MNLTEAMRIFQYPNLPDAGKVQQDFATRFSVLQQSKAQASDAARKQAIMAQVEDLKKARDVLLQAIACQGGAKAPPKPSPAGVQPRKKPNPSPTPARPAPGPAPMSPTTPPAQQAPLSGPQLWPAPPMPPPIGGLPWGRVVGLVVSLLLLFVIVGTVLGRMNAVDRVDETPLQKDVMQSPPPEPGHLTVIPYPWAEVELEREGRVEARWEAPHRDPRPLKPGRYRLRLKFIDGQQIEREVEIPPGRHRRLIVNRVEGELRVE